MKKIISILSIAALLILSTGCIKEYDLQQGTVTSDQAANAPGAFDNFVKSIETAMCGNFFFSNQRPYDIGYPGFYIMRDMTGQDMVSPANSHDWFSTWYEGGTGMNPRYLVCQLPWTYFYKWIKNCNIVISLAGEEPSEEHMSGAGIAYAMRALYYLPLLSLENLIPRNE